MLTFSIFTVHTLCPFLEIGTLVTLEAYKFVCKPLIEMKFERKVVALVKSFPTVCRTPFTHKEVKATPDF
jgi:hypothetical protein